MLGNKHLSNISQKIKKDQVCYSGSVRLKNPVYVLETSQENTDLYMSVTRCFEITWLVKPKLTDFQQRFLKFILYLLPEKEH